MEAHVKLRPVDMMGEGVFLCGTAHAPKLLSETVVQAQAVAYPDVLRDVLSIPESKIFFLGIAVGFPEWDNPVNRFRTEREPLESISTWHGF